MSGSNITFQLTGSIACYKSCGLISTLVQEGYNVQTVVTKSALNFIGTATLEGLTGRPVLSDTFENGKMMGHIDLIKWTDLFIIAPATANTINKLAAGIADDFLGSLFLANNFQRPYLISPAMNTQMLEHPATRKSLKTLSSWGCQILDTDMGPLACKDVGKGRLLDVSKIERLIKEKLPSRAECGEMR